MSPASTLPPLPMHAPSTPTSGHGRPPGAGPSSSHHRAHQSQVALTSSSTRSDGLSPNATARKSAFSPPAGSAYGSPSTPTKKRLFNYTSPAATRLAALTNNGGLDDMAHERYSLSPVGKESQSVLMRPRKGVRQIARTPFKVLDAPDLAVSSCLLLRFICVANDQGRFLPESGFLVLVQCTCGRSQFLRLPVECPDE
jgi:cell division cycle 20-like protein 1 (cofactor of APC complex)